MLRWLILMWIIKQVCFCLCRAAFISSLNLYLNGWEMYLYMDCPEIIRPFWISWESVMWPWCNLTASQRRPFCASVNSFLSHGASQLAVRRRWLNLCTAWPSHLQWPSKQISYIVTMRLPILQLSCRLFLAKYHITQACQPLYSPDLSPCDFWLFRKLKSPLEVRFVNAMVTHYTSSVIEVSLESDGLRMHSKVSSDWLPSYIKATRPVLEIFKMDG